MPRNQLPAVTKFISKQNGYLQREKVSLSEAFLAVYRPDVTLKELCSCGNLSESKLQNRGRYLFWRDFFDFVLKNVSLKEESRYNCKVQIHLYTGANTLFGRNNPIRTTKDICTSDKTKQSVQTNIIYTLPSVKTSLLRVNRSN